MTTFFESKWFRRVAFIAIVILSGLAFYEEGTIKVQCKQQGYQGGGWDITSGRYCSNMEQVPVTVYKYELKVYPYGEKNE